VKSATKRFVDFADCLPERLLLVSPDGIIHAANRDALDAVFGGAEPVAGRPLTEFVENSAGQITDFLRLCSRSRTPLPGALTFRARHGRRAGEFRCAGWTIKPEESAQSRALVVLRLVPKRPTINRFLALNEKVEQLTREIHLRNRAELAAKAQHELLQVTLASIGDAVIATDTRGCVTFMNPVAELYTGWSSTEAINAPLDQMFVVLDEDTREPVEHPVQQVLASGQVVALADRTLLVRRDGTELPIDDSGAPIRDGVGRLVGVVLVFREVAKQRKLERELQRQAAALRDTDKRKDDFLAMLGHELRNPLAPLNHCVQILRNREHYAVSVDQLADMMGRQTTQLTRIVDDLLDLSRITRGRIRLERSPTPLATVLQHAIETTHVVIEQRGHTLEAALPAETLLVHGDLSRLSQVFCNLLTNAAKFMDPGGTIEVSAGVEGGHAVVRVRDYGMGLPESLRPYVFDLFSQGELGLDRSQGGLGIGLTLVKNLVEMHEGQVAAFSDGPDKGSEFVVTIPVATGASAAIVASPSAPRPVKKRVLIVDDNVDAAEALALYLAACGCEVRSVHEARSAIEIGRTDPPDAILLDIGLPGIDGYEAARQLRSLPGSHKFTIIAVTGYGSEQDRQRTRGAGFDHHLTKPVDLPTLLDLLRPERP
jgi:PAS domain S-box-containing protein